MRILTTLLLSLSLAACGTTDSDDNANVFGAGVTEGPTVAVEAALSQPSEFAGKTVRIAGPVQSVCKKKGCWVEVGQGEETVMVKFKDYAFFLPLDCEGRELVAEGELQVTELSVEERRHYLEDAGKHEEAAMITEPETRVTFMASGVKLSPAPESAGKKDSSGSK